MNEKRKLAENRLSRRISTRKAAKFICPSDLSLIDCVIRDASAHGARLDFPSPVLLPKEFVLQIGIGDIIQTSARCIVKWTSAQSIGVMFLDPVDVIPISNPLRQNEREVPPVAITGNNSPATPFSTSDTVNNKTEAPQNKGKQIGTIWPISQTAELHQGQSLKFQHYTYSTNKYFNAAYVKINTEINRPGRFGKRTAHSGKLVRLKNLWKKWTAKNLDA